MRPESMHPGHRVSRRGLAVLALVPLLAVAMLLGLVRGGRDQGVQAAVVNLDQAVEVNGQLVPLGRQLASNMMARDGANITWTLADLPDAEAGLREGRYSAVVVIPEGFSAAATSFSANDAETVKQAKVQVTVSKNAPVTDAGVAREIAVLATDTINATLTKGYLDNIYIGFNTVGEQLDQIVDGAARLEEGGEQVADGLTQAADGSSQLATGLGTLASQGKPLGVGARDLAAGSGQLADGAGRLAPGADQLSAGADALARGLGQFKDQAPQLVAGVNQLVHGAEPLLEGIPAYTGGASQLVDGVTELRAGLVQLEEGLKAQSDVQGLAEVQAALSQLSSALREMRAAIDTYFPGGGADAITVEELRAAAEAFDAQLTRLEETVAGYAAGTAPLPPEVRQLVDQMVAAWECPLNDPQTCEELRAAYAAGVTEAIGRGFQEGAKTVSDLLNQTDPATGKTPLQTARGFSQLALKTSESLVTLRDALTRFLPPGTDPLTALEELPGRLAAQAEQLLGGVTKLREGADTIVEGGQPLKTNGQPLANGAGQLLEGLRTMQSRVGALPAGAERLADGAGQLASGGRDLASGTGDLAGGASELAAGADQFAAGTSRYVEGVDQVALASTELSAGLLRLGEGAGELSSGLGEFHDQLAAGAAGLPTYGEAERAALSEAVASPVVKDTEVHGLATISIAALLGVAALWLGAALAYAFAQPVPSDLVASSRSTMTLWLRTLGLPAGIGAGTGLLVGLAIGATLGMPVGRTLGVAGVLALLGMSFTLVNHTLAAWLGNIGRGVAALFLVLTVALGLTSRVPRWVASVAGVSPLHNGLQLVRTYLAGGSGLAGLGGLALLLAVIAFGLSYLALATKRSLTPAQFRTRIAGGEGS